MRWLTCTVALLTLLSGCTGPATPDNVVDESPAPSNSGAAQALDDGLLQGTVLDGAGRALEGVSMTTPGLPTVVTSASGAFSFGRVPVGEYAVTAAHPDYQPLTKQVTVTKDGTTNLAFALDTPNRNGNAPYQTALKYTGFAIFTADALTGASMMVCDECTFTYPLNTDELETVVISVAATRGELEDDSFYVIVESPLGQRVANGYTTNPGDFHVSAHLLDANWTELHLEVYPFQFVPALNREFEVIVTSFHREAAPETWTATGPPPPT